MNTNTITSVARLINNYIADLSERVTRFDHEIAPEYDTLGGDRFCVKVYESYNKIEIIHDGGCSWWFRHIAQNFDRVEFEHDGDETPRDELTSLLEKRGWHCDATNAYHTVYMIDCPVSITTHATTITTIN
jgi:hypothetical protein